MSKVSISKKPDLIITEPTNTTYRGLSQSELLNQVKLLHEQIFKTNRYLMDVHRISIYNWQPEDVGSIIVDLHDNKGFLLDSVLKLRGNWDAINNEPELLLTDKTKIGWVYKVSSNEVTEQLNQVWKQGDYALYDTEGNLYNVTADMLGNLFTPILPIESDTIQIDPIEQSASNIQLRAHVKIDPDSSNDLQTTAKGIFSNAYEKARELISIQVKAPTKANDTGGIRIVFLEELPKTLYEGWLYLVPPHTRVIEETE